MSMRLPSAFGAAAGALALALAAPGAPALSAPAAPAAPAPTGCAPDGGLSFVCGANNPEDLVVVPGTTLLVASGMVGDGVHGGLHLVDSRAKTVTPLRAGPGVAPDPLYPACAGPPAPGFTAHGLAIRAEGRGRSRLYVVAHGQRESVEIFQLDLSSAKPALAWLGCVKVPEGLVANSVTALPDGRVLATVLFRNGRGPAESFEGKATGTVLSWRKGQARFVPIPGSALPANNGIESSADGRTVWVAASGSKQVVEFSAADLSHPLRRAQLAGFAPDNVRLSPDGTLLAAGMTDNEPACGGPPVPVNGKLIFTCHRGYMVARIDPKTMVGTTVAQGPRNPSFSGATTALRMGAELWVASLMGDRLAYRPWP